MEFIKVSAKTVNDAIMEASIQLGTSSDNIEYDVIQTGSSGFFGIGSKPAIIQARKREDDSLDFEKALKEPLKNIYTKKENKKPARKPQKDQVKQNENKPEKKAEKKPAEKKQVEKKTVEKKQENKPEKPVEVKKTVEEKPVVKEKIPVNKEEAQQRAKEFLQKIFKAMDMQVEIEMSFDNEDNLNIDLKGGDMGILIGKRGQTLDSIQYLTSLAVNKGKSSYVRVKVDTENYRIRRKETLENLAKNIAFKVKRTRRPVFLEPMNPYERRVIHSALQNDPKVSTHSEGEEPYRKVVVTLKK